MKIRKVLAYGLPVMKNMSVIAACNRTGAEFRLIKEDEAHKSLGSLAKALGLENKAPENDSSINPGEMLVFAGFEGNQIDDFLSEYKKSGIGSVLYKAVLTEYNVLWSPAFLYEEMEKEHKEIESNK